MLCVNGKERLINNRAYVNVKVTSYLAHVNVLCNALTTTPM